MIKHKEYYSAKAISQNTEGIAFNFMCYLHQSLHLGPVCVQLLSQTGFCHAEHRQLRPQRSHHLIETHLNKEMVSML